MILFRSGSASGGYSSGLEAAYHNYGNITCSLILRFILIFNRHGHGELEV